VTVTGWLLHAAVTSPAVTTSAATLRFVLAFI
jgi:hypothetical protein